MLKKTINFSIMEDIISSYLYWGLRFSLSDGFIRNKYFFPISIGKVTNIFTDNEEFLKLVERLNSFFVFFLIYSIVSLLTRISTDIFTKSFIKELYLMEV